MERPSPGQEKDLDITMFIISYALNNLVSGIIYDTYVNYMQEMARSVATSFWAFLWVCDLYQCSDAAADSEDGL